MRVSPRLMAAAAAAMLWAAPAIGADLQVGQAAPDFTLPDQTGKIHRLSDYRGKTVILAFFPKALTGG